MKRGLQKIMMLAVFALMSFSLSAQLSKVIDESFESGIPADWTQEQLTGDFSWIVENENLTRPDGAYSGNSRVAFRNPSQQTQHYVSRLITPVMDLSNVYQPILCFAHAQDKWTHDFDVLKIYYRTAPEAEWVLLKTFDEYIPTWQLDTVMLVGVTDKYQVAFEGYDNLGRGIVLDDVEVRSMPNCLQPYNLLASNISNDSVTVSWAGSFDSETFHVKVSTSSLDVATLDNAESKADVMDSIVSGELYSLDIKELTAGKTYYLYVKANCDGESSLWSDEYVFKTSNLAKAPYRQTLNLDYTPGYLGRVAGWYYGTSTEDFCPFINTSSTETQRIDYSPDGTTALFFAGGNSVSEAIGGGQWAYAAGPEMQVESLSDLQVEFYGTFDDMDEDGRTHRLIVGAMTDPTDFNTFVPVDTVELLKLSEFREFIVSFADYTGNGKHVALASNFKTPNFFIVDDVRITERPACPKAQFTYGLPSATEIAIKCKDTGLGCEVIAAEELLDASNPDMTRVKATASSSTAECTLTGLTPWTTYYVYVRMKCSEGVYGEWSNPQEILTPAKVTKYPYLVDFEIDEKDESTYYMPLKYAGEIDMLSKGTLVLTNWHTSPSSSKGYWNSTSPTSIKQLSKYELEASAIWIGQSIYMIFPENTDMANSRVGFYSTQHAVVSPSRYCVGVMSDAADTSTFVAIDTITPEFGYKRYEYDLRKYASLGKFFAVKLSYIDWEDNTNDYTYCYIDDVLFETIPECAYPDDVTVEALPTGANIKWNANGASEWNVMLLDRDILYDSINNISYESIVERTIDIGLVYIDTVNTNSVSIGDLFPERYDYYVYIRPVCSGVPGMWTSSIGFETACLERESLPYVMNFDVAPDGTSYSTSSSEPDFAVPCMFSKKSRYVNRSYYPYLSTSQKFSGNQSLYLTCSKSSRYDSYVAYPKMDAKIQDLQVSFWMHSGDLKYDLQVGVMTDPMDTNTFTLVQTVRPEVKSEWREYIVPFTGYNGEGEYIAMRTGTAESYMYFYVDSVIIDRKASCAKMQGLRAASTTDVSASLTWTGDKEKSWRMVVSKKELTVEELDAAVKGDDIVFVDNVPTNPYTVEGLESNMPYFFYVKAICSDTEQGKWSTAGKFRTNCVILDAGELGVENFDTYGTGYGTAPTCYVASNVSRPDLPAWIPQCATKYSHSGAASLKIESSTTFNGAYAITPKLDVDKITRLRVRFYGSASTYITPDYAHQLVVGVITDPQDLASFTPVDTLDFFGEGTRYEVRFDGYKGDYDENYGKYVMFFSEFDKKNIVYIDDVVFDTIPECVSPDVRVDSVGQTEAKLSLNGGKAPYKVLVSKNILSEEYLDTASVSSEENGVLILDGQTSTVNLAGLVTGTDYYVYAKSDCGNDAEWSNVIHFVTECLDKVGLPYVDDFDANTTTGTYSNPRCWTSYYSAQGSELQYPYVYATGYEGKAVYVYSESKTKQSYLVTPYIDAELNNVQVSFYARSNTTSATTKRNIIVGVADSVSTDGITGFTPIDTITDILGSSIYEKYIISFEKYTGTGRYIVFTNSHALNRSSLTSTTGTSGGYYMDEVEVDVIPTCPKPDYFVLTDKSDKELSFSFDPMSDAENFEVRYGATGVEVEQGTLLPVNANSFTITGLTANTEYDVYIRALCGENDNSKWAMVGTYSTTAEPVSKYPFTCDFENEEVNAKWEFAGGDNINQWYVGAAYPKDGAKSLYISKDEGVSATYQNDKISYSWVYMPFELTEGVYSVSFDWTCYGEGNSDYIRIGFLPTTAVFSSENNTVRTSDGSSVSFTHAATTNPNGWLELNENESTPKFNLVDTTKADQWVHNSKNLIVPKDAAGCYFMVMYWKNNGNVGKHPTPSAVVDNIVVDKATCGIAIDLKVEDLLDTAATISWTPLGDNVTDFKVAIYDAEVDIESAGEENRIIIDTTQENRFTVQKLTSQTTYYAYVQMICGEEDGFWYDALKFTTPCAATAIDTVFDFDDEAEMYYKPLSTGSEQKMAATPNCFESYNVGVTYDGKGCKFYPYLIENTNYDCYSRSGNWALYFNANSATNMGGYIVLPYFDTDVKDLEVSFYMRCVYESKSKGSVSSASNLGNTYTRSITVGTMSDPTDESTFKPIQVVTYPFTNKDLTTSMLVNNDPMGEKYWRKFTVPLAEAEGRYIVFRNDTMGTLVKGTTYIDDIEVTRSRQCPIPYDVTVSGITDTKANVAFSHVDGKKWVVKYSENADLLDTLRIDTITTPQYDIDWLRPASTYYVSVQQICGGESGASEWTYPVKITTAHSVRFAETFAASIRCPETWSRASSPSAGKLFDGTSKINIVDPTITAGWSREYEMFDAGMFSTGHMSTYILGTSNTYWLFTPTVNLPKEGNLHLTFDLALTDKDSNSPLVGDDLLGVDDKFMVIVSADGGDTWKEEDATVWDNSGLGDYVLNSVPNTGRQYRVDLNKYAGKVIKVAFYIESTVVNATVEMHLDNVAINTMVEEPLSDAICQMEDYRTELFDIIDTVLEVGVNKYERMALASRNVPDTLYKLTLNVTPSIETTFEDHICEGYLYDKHNFNVTTAGTFRQKYRSSNGCDSIVTLILTNEASRRTFISDTICQGTSYSFNGEEYNRTGVYIDTLVSTVTQCDSIVTLTLKVNDAIQAKDSVTVCFGETYEFGKYGELKESGTYIDTMETATGCDSIVTLKFTVQPDFRKTITATICEGETYDENGFSGVNVSGTFPLPLQSKDGCDSTLTLVLTVLSGDTTRVEFKITTEELPYTYESITYPEGTKAGTYIDTINVSTANCDNVIIHKLVIEEKVGVDNVSYRKLTLTPNPVERGTAVVADLDLPAEEARQLTVVVYDMSGSEVKRFTAYDKPVVIDCDFASGVYLVRITTMSGDVYHGKLIVK